MASIGKVLETATSRTEEGSRPADGRRRVRCAADLGQPAGDASDMRLEAKPRTEPTSSPSPGAPGSGLHFGRLRAVRVDLQVGLERRDRVGNLAEVERRHAELIVRHRHVRVGLGRRLELRLGLGELAGVEQDDALVVERFGLPPPPAAA